MERKNKYIKKSEAEEKRGLIIKQPYASMIVKGIKKWELRKRRTNVRGDVIILSGGNVLGKAELVDVKGPFSVEELRRFKHLHRVDEKELEEYSEGRELYAWVFESAEEFDHKQEVKIPRGAQVWVRLEKTGSEAELPEKRNESGWKSSKH